MGVSSSSAASMPITVVTCWENYTIRIKFRMLSTAHRLPSSSIVMATNIWDGVRLLRQVWTLLCRPLCQHGQESRKCCQGGFFFFLTFVALLAFCLTNLCRFPFCFFLLRGRLQQAKLHMAFGWPRIIRDRPVLAGPSRCRFKTSSPRRWGS